MHERSPRDQKQLQRGPATVLVQLLDEYPDLPTPSWHIGRLLGQLDGALLSENSTFEALRLWADALGGTVRPGHDFEHQGETLRPHHLDTVWRDVRVRISVNVPLAVPAVDDASVAAAVTSWDRVLGPAQAGGPQ